MKWKDLYKKVKNSGGLKDSARIRKTSKYSARELKHMSPSEAHTRGGLGTEKILDELGKFEPDQYSLPVLSVNGRVIYDNSNRAIHIAGLPGGFKTTALGLVFAGTWRGSLLCLDPDHEYSRATWRLRRFIKNNKVYFVNPRGRHGIPSSCWNFFETIIDAIHAGDIERALNLAKDVSFILVRDRPDGKTGDNDWVTIAAREILVMALLYLAKDQPKQCTPSGLYTFLMQPVAKVLNTIGKNASLAPVMRRLLQLQGEYSAGALRQVTWKFHKASEPLSLFEPESCYAKITNKSDFSPEEAKTGDKPVTIYLGVDGDELESAGPFISLFISMAIERIAAAQGSRRTLILAEEFAAMPRAAGLIKAGRAYRKRGLKVVTIAQTRHSVSDRWGETIRKDIEAMAGTVVWIAPELEVARELETKSGTKTVLSHGARDGDSGHVGKSLNETKAPNLHVSEIFYLPDDKAILEMRGVPGLIVADLIPWWEIHPLNEQISEAYRDDFYEYDGPEKETD